MIEVLQDSPILPSGSLFALYDTIAYLDHGDEKQRLGGNMPIKVDMRTGTCRLLSSEEVLEYMNKGLIH